MRHPGDGSAAPLEGSDSIDLDLLLHSYNFCRSRQRPLPGRLLNRHVLSPRPMTPSKSGGCRCYYNFRTALASLAQSGVRGASGGLFSAYSNALEFCKDALLSFRQQRRLLIRGIGLPASTLHQTALRHERALSGAKNTSARRKTLQSAGPPTAPVHRVCLSALL